MLLRWTVIYVVSVSALSSCLTLAAVFLGLFSPERLLWSVSYVTMMFALGLLVGALLERQRVRTIQAYLQRLQISPR